MGKLVIMDVTGHTTVEWDVDTVDVAKREFARNLLNGHLAVSDGKLIREFDPEAAEITVLPIMVGG